MPYGRARRTATPHCSRVSRGYTPETTVVVLCYARFWSRLVDLPLRVLLQTQRYDLGSVYLVCVRYIDLCIVKSTLSIDDEKRKVWM